MKISMVGHLQDAAFSPGIRRRNHWLSRPCSAYGNGIGGRYAGRDRWRERDL